MGGTAIEAILTESQKIMAHILLEFHEALSLGSRSPVEVWITGYSEMKKGGIFQAFTDELKLLYKDKDLKDAVFLYRHFSMNQFTIDLKRQAAPTEPLAETLKRIGAMYRQKYCLF
jgi:hypothetical protein